MSNLNPIGRSSIKSVSFFILGSDDAEEEASGVTSTKHLFSDGVPVLDGLYNPLYGLTIYLNC